MASHPTAPPAVAGCLLCGRPPFALGVWVLDEATARRFGAPPGKRRAIVYSACRRCESRPGFRDRVRAKITGEAELLAGVPDNY